MGQATTAGRAAAQSPMKRLYARLRAANLDPKFVANVALPEWWEDNIAETEAGYARALGLIANHLSIDLAALWNESAQLTCPDFGKTNFKKTKGVSEADVAWPKCVALSVARIALQALEQPYRPLPSTGAQIRAEIMQGGARWVGLATLVDYLWQHGLPVLHVSVFPAHTKKMAGLAAKVDGRPVIILAKNHPFSSLVLFDLAHELGHILCRHLDNVSIVVDSAIGRIGDSLDPEETDANKAAVETLTGRSDLQYDHHQPYVTAQDLARLAVNTSKKQGVDPGVAAQNFGHGRGIYALANGACKIIEPKADPVGLVRQSMIKHLRIGELPPEDAEFLLRVTGVGLANGAAV